MDDVIEQAINKKPHLLDPLRFYAKTVKFVERVRALPITTRKVLSPYPAATLDVVFGQLSLLFDLPEGALSPLKQAMEAREIDFSRLPMNEIPSFSLPYPEDDLSILLYILSKPYFAAAREARSRGNMFWEEGKCPVCMAQPSFSWFTEGGMRRVWCPFCETTGDMSGNGCPICRAEDAAEQRVLTFRKEEAFPVSVCDLCRSYVKTVDAGRVSQWSPAVADLISLPLDIVVQEKGYVRRSPNPIGMRKMTMRG